MRPQLPGLPSLSALDSPDTSPAITQMNCQLGRGRWGSGVGGARRGVGGPTLQPSPSAPPWFLMTVSSCLQGLCLSCSFCLKKAFSSLPGEAQSAFRAQLQCRFLQGAFLNTQPFCLWAPSEQSHPCVIAYTAPRPFLPAHTCYMLASVYLCGCWVNGGSSLLTPVSPAPSRQPGTQ